MFWFVSSDEEAVIWASPVIVWMTFLAMAAAVIAIFVTIGRK
jgi:hypothetical protein